MPSIPTSTSHTTPHMHMSSVVSLRAAVAGQKPGPYSYSRSALAYLLLPCVTHLCLALLTSALRYSPLPRRTQRFLGLLTTSSS